MSDLRLAGNWPSSNSLLDLYLSAPRPVYFGGFVVGTVIALLPLLAIHAVA